MTAAAETSITGIEGESVLQSVGQGARDAAAAASEHAAKVRQLADEAGYDPSQTLSRLAYTGAYALAYGVVYAAVFAAQSLPQENPVMRGFHDGGRAARDRLETGTD